MAQEIHGALQGNGMKIGIIVSRFNEIFTSKLKDGAIDCLERHGVESGSIDVVYVPGAFEIPFAARKAAASEKYDGVLCLGAVIRGGTPHFEYIASEVSKGVASVALSSAVPVSFGVITTDTLEQAMERSGSKSGNKGAEAALALIEMINVCRKL